MLPAGFGIVGGVWICGLLRYSKELLDLTKVIDTTYPFG